MRTIPLLCLLVAALVAALAVNAEDRRCGVWQKHCITTDTYGDTEGIELVTPNLRARILSKGATLSNVQVRVPQVNKTADSWVDVALGFHKPEETRNDTAYMGRVVGRYAGRIGKGQITLDNTTYKLPQNDGNNTLHGGPDGFSFREWNYTLLYSQEMIGVRFEMVSPHMDQGFPGALHVTATYSISKDEHATLRWNLQAELLKDSPANTTVVNLCNHVYWNLNGVPRGPSPKQRHVPDPVTNHHMVLHASHFLKTDASLLPWGEVMLVNGTAHDFRAGRVLKEGIDATAAEGRDPAGYDDPVTLDDWDGTVREAAVLTSPKTGIRMQLSTTSPAVIMYTANHLPENATGAPGDRFQRHSGIALETQYFPNSPHVPAFPSTELRKGQKYDETTVCRFSITGSA